MKKIFSALVLGCMALTLIQAQSMDEEMDYFQAIFGMGKKAAMAEFLTADKQDSESFWALYDEYEMERKLLGKKRIELLEAYAEGYGTWNDEELAEVMKGVMDQKKSLDKLVDKYYKKVMKSEGAVAAAQFWQFENYLLSAIRLLIMEEMPFIGELDM